MARSIDERDRMAVAGHAVGADVLGDAARLARRHLGLADRVEEGSLAVVDVAHQRHHRGAGLEQVLLRLGRLRLLHRLGGGGRMGQTVAALRIEGEAELRAHLLGRFLVEHLGEGGEDVQLHQVMDQLERLEAEVDRQILDHDRSLDDDDLLARRADLGMSLRGGLGSRRRIRFRRRHCRRLGSGRRHRSRRRRGCLGRRRVRGGRLAGLRHRGRGGRVDLRQLHFGLLQLIGGFGGFVGRIGSLVQALRFYGGGFFFRHAGTGRWDDSA